MSTSLSKVVPPSPPSPSGTLLGESVYPYYFLSLLPGSNVPWGQCKESQGFSLASDQTPRSGQVPVPLCRLSTWVDPCDRIMSFRKHPIYLFLIFFSPAPFLSCFFLATLLQGLMAGDPPSVSPPERAEYVNIGKIVL